MPRINNKRKGSNRNHNNSSKRKNNPGMKYDNNNNKNNNNNTIKPVLDETDKKIIELLISNHNNNFISKKLRIPLSTIQRRTRRLFEKDVVSTKIELNYEKLGYKRGLLHIYLQKGLMNEIGKIVVEKRGMISVSVHVGNSDLVALFVYRDSKDLLETINEIKEIEGVERAMWSEEVYLIPSNSQMTLFT